MAATGAAPPGRTHSLEPHDQPAEHAQPRPIPCSSGGCKQRPACKCLWLRGVSARASSLICPARYACSAPLHPLPPPRPLTLQRPLNRQRGHQLRPREDCFADIVAIHRGRGMRRDPGGCRHARPAGMLQLVPVPWLLLSWGAARGRDPALPLLCSTATAAGGSGWAAKGAPCMPLGASCSSGPVVSPARNQ